MNKGWDGTYKNKKVDQVVYVYMVDYSFKENKILRQNGIVTLLRSKSQSSSFMAGVCLSFFFDRKRVWLFGKTPGGLNLIFFTT